MSYLDNNNIKHKSMSRFQNKEYFKKDYLFWSIKIIFINYMIDVSPKYLSSTNLGTCCCILHFPNARSILVIQIYNSRHVIQHFFLLHVF